MVNIHKPPLGGLFFRADIIRTKSLRNYSSKSDNYTGFHVGRPQYRH
jgi:hypothetical protein